VLHYQQGWSQQLGLGVGKIEKKLKIIGKILIFFLDFFFFERTWASSAPNY
jgi:hypothetical protein